MSAVIAASAIGTLMSYGYTEAEAKRIRAFLPRRFQTFGQPLPPTNIDAWLAYRAVKHYLVCSDERGSFIRSHQPSGYLSMQNIEQMEYVTKKETIKFSTVEFVRHFGDAFYTDMNEEAGHRVARLNNDGSFVIKNRRLLQLCQEIEQRASKGGVTSGIGLYGMANIGEFFLPQEEQYSASDIYTLFTQGKLAKEYSTSYDFRRSLVSGVDFHQVAKYLYFLYCEALKGVGSWMQFSHDRMSIMNNIRNRTVDFYTQFPHPRGGCIYFEDHTVMTPWGITHAQPIPMNMHTVPQGYTADHEMVRLSLNGHMCTSPLIPLYVKNYFSDEEWQAVLR